MSMKKYFVLVVALMYLVFLPVSGGAVSAEDDANDPITIPYWEYPEEFIYGAMTIGYHGGGGPYDEVFHMVLQELGITNARVSMAWDWSNRIRGEEYDWTIEPDLDVLEEYGLEPIVLLVGTPEWASGVGEAEEQMFKDKDAYHLRTVAQPGLEYLEDYRQWVRAVAERFKGRVKYYEFWNEPNGYGWPIIVYDDEGNPVDFLTGGDSQHYSEYLKVTYETIKEVDPEAQVSLAGLCPGSTRMTFLEELYEMGANSYFDAVAIHPYGTLTGDALMYDWLEDARALMIEHGDEHKPIWVTEWGYRVNPNKRDLLELKAERVREALDYFRETPWVTIAHFHYFLGNTDDVWDLYRPHVYNAFVETRWGHESKEVDPQFSPEIFLGE